MKNLLLSEIKRNLLCGVLIAITFNLIAGQYERKENSLVEVDERFEISILNSIIYKDPYRDVELKIELIDPDGKKILHYGFYDGNQTWKIRFSPDIIGEWKYIARFSDDSDQIAGTFTCSGSGKPGRIIKDKNNPFWLGKAGEEKTLFRSFHVGDRFFAMNWDDPTNDSDENLRTQFLDWLQENKYNMLSIASHYSNRNQTGRGRGWNTPILWPLDYEQYQKMEIILDDLKERGITVFPFAGFFGVSGSWPTNHKDQELYIKYTLARIGHYPNIILSVSGPEPLIFGNRESMKGNMRFEDIQRLGNLINRLDVHNHILTVHNETMATKYGDLFVDEAWYTLSTMQGPKTLVADQLYAGLVSNRHRYKPAFAQETLWGGNIYHPQYSHEQLRKHLYTILFSGYILNFGDMNGDSSSGFSGSMNLNDRFQERHEILKKVWDWFETISFNHLTSRYDLVSGGFCLANEGTEYLIYKESRGKITLFLDFPYPFTYKWINAQNTDDIRQGQSVSQKHDFYTPEDGDDWILHVYVPK